MESDFIHEPELEFAGGRHIDIKFGQANWGPLDVLRAPSPKHIRLGIVGTPETIERLSLWLERCKGEIPAKDSNRPNLFPPFPGFNSESTFQAELSSDATAHAILTTRDLDAMTKAKAPVITKAVERIAERLHDVAEKSAVDVFVCAPPTSLLEATSSAEEPQTSGHGVPGPPADFHDLLKARCMALRRPIQLILPATYDRSAKQFHPRTRRPRQIQDEATRAWNFHTAIYYKAGWVPWRLVRDPAALTTCFVGVSFYFSLDRRQLGTSVAQVFNERGEGIIVRGAGAQISRDDRQPHLSENDAADLMRKLLDRYRDEHHTYPARVVLHKTSHYSPDELGGFSGMVDELHIDSLDLVVLSETGLRLLRNGAYPPLRGTTIALGPGQHLLYTRGSVDFFATYPGMYVPAPLLLNVTRADQTPRFLCEEILSLTKMNWNNTQFDGAEPITTRAARQVATILKYVVEDSPIATRYSFYM